MGGALAPTLFAQVASGFHRGGSESVGPEGPPTEAKALPQEHRLEAYVGGASAPTPFAQVASGFHRDGSESVGPEGPPTAAKALP
ncbi:hypothetical protein GLE_2661 [Lysobacter enzymogenes]|uniref:Uncharacterized protein n=1 Tax=Lysobacter enzymogenes TaxID=69 RepID=A0A0S2DHM6_LYSEN|nr:hypothetical protein GLE_2661 [Lysobacter enzymogenes]